MKFTIQKPHSVIDLITNSSMEMFLVEGNVSINAIDEMLHDKCENSEDPFDMEWYNNELSIYEDGRGNIEVHSFLNEPDWLYDFMYSTFKVIEYDN